MDSFYTYVTNLWGKISQIYWWVSSSSTPANNLTDNQTEPSESSHNHDIPVTQPAQTPVSAVREGSGPAPSTVNSHSVHPQNPSQCYPNFTTDPDEIAKLDKININVKCAGKIMEVNMFPLERISVLLKEACEMAGKKPEKMCLVIEGEHLDVNKTVQQCGLRGGTTVNLIHA